ncbi:hypothetical protein BD410DRAFT_148445 [Rickenella mellea]|uniref:LYC1 C-terminal domain-containing protein n=1 Tax=Rickenella mellea TaxID=50990 RepID=A0A4Y7Q9G4_9AGAM|nr:hypothetical protein BD410DRAFT_148445 [Rickenella mellea]
MWWFSFAWFCSYRRKALVRKAGSLSPDESICYSITSVFTPPANRRKGYARHMMRLLHWVLAPRDISSLPSFPSSWGLPPPEVPGFGNASFSALYSDVGEFYQSAGPAGTDGGWVICDPIATTWEVARGGTPSPTSNGLRWLDEVGVCDIWTNDVELIRSDMAIFTPRKNLFTMLPNAVGAFPIRRAEFYLQGQPDKLPSKWGVSTPDAFGQCTFATWTVDVCTPPTLVLTRLRATPTSFPSVLTAIFEAAREYGAENVEVWNLPKELEEFAHSVGGNTVTKNEQLNCFKWYGPERGGDVQWLFNEKFCWC